MFAFIDWGVLVLGVLIFCSRVIDVTMGTLRTISIVQGRSKLAFFLGFIEISMWLFVLSTVLTKVLQQPILALFYALGFSTGNVMGIYLERKIALGHTILRIITQYHAEEMTMVLRESGFAVTTFSGEGMTGPVVELYIVCERKELKQILSIVKKIEPEAFYLTEHAGSVSKIYRPTMVPRTGWRAILKKK